MLLVKDLSNYNIFIDYTYFVIQNSDFEKIDRNIELKVSIMNIMVGLVLNRSNINIEIVLIK